MSRPRRRSRSSPSCSSLPWKPSEPRRDAGYSCLSLADWALCPFDSELAGHRRSRQRTRTMNKSELIDAAAASTGLRKTDVQHALEAIIETITDEVGRGNKVMLT